MRCKLVALAQKHPKCDVTEDIQPSHVSVLDLSNFTPDFTSACIPSLNYDSLLMAYYNEPIMFHRIGRRRGYRDTGSGTTINASQSDRTCTKQLDSLFCYTQYNWVWNAHNSPLLSWWLSQLVHPLRVQLSSKLTLTIHRGASLIERSLQLFFFNETLRSRIICDASNPITSCWTTGTYFHFEHTHLLSWWWLRSHAHTCFIPFRPSEYYNRSLDLWCQPTLEQNLPIDSHYVDRHMYFHWATAGWRLELTRAKGRDEAE